tara:strand:+ start:176 stop:481 length:306 start_codon:yes stop_codon:yes gene_type:complete
MNERILELVKQAGLKSEIMLDDSSRDVECFVTQYDGSTPSIHYWEKFAELIVRECIDITNAEMDDILDQPVFNPTDEIWNRARVEELVRVVKLIKKRFGVE